LASGFSFSEHIHQRLLPESRPGKSVGPLVATMNLAAPPRGTPYSLLGVVYKDDDGDNFYSVGEGIGKF